MSDKIKKEIFNGVGENVKALAQLFPSAVKDGEVDFAALKQELGEFVEVGAEKYDFTWAGKAKAKAEAVTDIPGRTLKYVQGDGVNEDTTGNLYIEGDNLEALKLLRNSYYNKIKMIYIDPPYNTGNDGFVYPDDFSVDRAVYEQSVGDRDENDIAMRFVKSNKDAGDYHTKWLNFMYKRLCIARDLLTDDGVIFVSIDDNEQTNLKKLCDEVFGESNFLNQFCWLNNLKGRQISNFGAVKTYETILCYAKSVINVALFQGKVEYLKKSMPSAYKGFNYETQKDERGLYVIKNELYNTNSIFNEQTRPNLVYNIHYNPITKEIKFSSISENKNFAGYVKILPKTNNNGIHKFQAWRWSQKKVIDESYDLEFIKFENTYKIYTKIRDFNLTNIKDIITDIGNGNSEMAQIFGSASIFSYPKSTDLIKLLISCVCSTDSIILDFFSGSATTAHAVMQLNAEDGGNRKYICVQVPELCDEKSEAFKAGYKNICEIGKERIRRAGKKIKADRNIKIGIDKSKLMQRTLLDDGTFEDKYDIKVTPCPDDDILDNLDIGFKVFKVADTNIRMFSNELNNVELLGQVDIKDIDPEQIDFNNGATDLDVCYELLLRHRGIPLSSKVGKLPIGERTYIIADSIVVCLDKQVTESLVEQLAAIDPLPNKYIFRDSSFGDDISLKENTMIHLQAIIEKNSGASKKTYTVEFI